MLIVAERLNSTRKAVARAIRARELSMLDVWFASLGPVASALLEAAVRGAIRRTPPPPPQKKNKEPQVIEGYQLVKRLGAGGIGGSITGDNVTVYHLFNIKRMAFETSRPPDMAMRSGTAPAGPVYGPAPDEIEGVVEEVVRQLLKA